MIDRNLGGRAIGRSPGNLYSDVVKVEVTPTSKPISLECANVVQEPVFKETARVKEFHIESRLLSAF
ncbi:hypothetical protein, partial [Enterococcus faecium]